MNPIGWLPCHRARGCKSTGGPGRLAAPTADSLAYAIEAGVQPVRGSRQAQGAFATSILRGFAAAGWHLAQSATPSLSSAQSAASYQGRRDGLYVQFLVFTDSSGLSGDPLCYEQLSAR